MYVCLCTLCLFAPGCVRTQPLFDSPLFQRWLLAAQIFADLSFRVPAFIERRQNYPNCFSYWRRARIWLQRARFQTRNSVSLFAFAEFRGESSVSLSQPISCARIRTHRVFRRTHRVCLLPQNSVSPLFRSSALETVFLPVHILGKKTETKN